MMPRALRAPRVDWKSAAGTLNWMLTIGLACRDWVMLACSPDT